MVEDEILVLEASQEELDEKAINDTKLILGSKNYVDSPLGKLEFSIDTNNKIGAYMDIYLEEGGLNINELIKTNLLNESFIFNSKN